MTATIPGDESIDLIVKLIPRYKTKQGLKNALDKQIKDSKHVGEVMKALKPLLADKK